MNLLQSAISASGGEDYSIPKVILSGVVSFFLGIIVIRSIPRYWNPSETDLEKLTRGFDWFGRRFSMGIRSATPIAGPMLLLWGSAFVMGGVRDAGWGPDVLGGLSTIAIMMGSLAGVLFNTIIFFGRPKILMPPYSRKFKGVVGEFVTSAFERVRTGREGDGTIRRDG